MKRKIGFIGLGKLGLPVAVCLGQKFSVIGYDANPDRMRRPIRLDGEQGDWNGLPAADLAADCDLNFGVGLDAMGDCEAVFLAVQTPHRPELEGTTPVTVPPEDFDYSYLVAAVKSTVQFMHKDQVLVIISTCLPGTIRREVLPITAGKCRVVYNPFFIAMGTVIKDFTRPEFVLLGGDDEEALETVRGIYREFYGKEDGFWPDDPPLVSMSIESAELTKVAYNCYISQKIVLANYLGELCHKIPGCDVDDVTGALKMATDRIVSSAYMNAGVGDAGGCHPRDNIAMSWLADRVGLSFDPCSVVTHARERQARWHVDLIYKHRGDLPVFILGKAYKPNVALTAGSYASLLGCLLTSRGVQFTHWDPHVDNRGRWSLSEPHLFFVATKHDCFRDFKFPAGSVVIDPFRYIPDQDGVRIIRIGKNQP